MNNIPKPPPPPERPGYVGETMNEPPFTLWYFVLGIAVGLMIAFTLMAVL